MANREAAVPNEVETAFNIGSINKVFTLIAIRQLALAGKLELDSTLSRYWPDYPIQEVARKVTVRQLLQHRSGIGDNIFGEPAGGTRKTLRRLSNFLPLFVYEPAGMTRTAHYAVDSLPPNTAIGYTRREQDAPDSVPRHLNTALLPGRGSSTGGGYSTAHDLLRFVQALREAKIPGGVPAGLGVAGGTGGINAIVEGELPGGYDLTVLINLDPPTAERVARPVRG